MKEIIIRVSTDKSAGRGHINRCLSIRKHLKFKVKWHIDKNKKDLKKILPKNDTIIVEKKNNSFTFTKCLTKNKKILLIDSYNISKKKKEKLTEFFRVISIEDKYLHLDISMGIYPNCFSDVYKTKTISLFGPKYAPINPIKKKKIKRKKTLPTVLISMGGYDSKAITIKAIQAIKVFNKFTNKKVNTNILITSNFQCLRECKELIKNNANMNIILNTDKIFDYINQATVCIGAPGVSHLERLYLGLPTILIAQNRNQKIIIDNWVKMNCALKAECSVRSILDNVKILLNNDKLRSLFKKNGQHLVDGKGAKRIAKKINLFENSRII